jgi:mRNA interferase RelE/StbE
MNYQVLIVRSAQQSLASLSKTNFERVRDAMLALSQNPRPPGCKKLTDRDGWRIRVGDYRVIYEIDDPGRTVTVLQVGHRSDIDS